MPYTVQGTMTMVFLLRRQDIEDDIRPVQEEPHWIVLLSPTHTGTVPLTSHCEPPEPHGGELDRPTFVLVSFVDSGTSTGH